LQHLCHTIIGGALCHHARYCLFHSPQHSWGIKFFINDGSIIIYYLTHI
jgi:hypothetical protein